MASTGVFLGNSAYPKLNPAVNRMAEEGVSPIAIAIAWILRYPAKVQPLIGTVNADCLRNICTATEVEMRRSEWYDSTV